MNVRKKYESPTYVCMLTGNIPRGSLSLYVSCDQAKFHHFENLLCTALILSALPFWLVTNDEA
jgi:hypothetical protein